MYLQTLFLICVCNAALIFQKTYQTTYLELNYKLQSNQQYLIQVIHLIMQMSILQFPDEQSCLPCLQVNITDQGATLTDKQGCYTKALIQNIYTQGGQVEINVFNRQLDIIPDSNSSKIISFTITIISSPPTQQFCYFPTYGNGCQQSIEQVETETDSNLIVPQHSWNYYYYVLDNYNYQLEVKCDWGTFAVAFLPIDKANVTVLPSFYDSNFLAVALGGQDVKIELNRISNIHDYVFAVGIYNFESEASITITVTKNDESEGSSFPVWAIVTIVAIVVFGVLISIFIICQLRKQAKVYEEKPKLPIETLDKYMPTKPVPKHQLPESCCVCLVQFLKRDQVRETPCKHFFHDRCLREWTHKNASCPVCRQDFNEVEIQKYLCLSQVHSQKNEFNNSHDGSGLPKIPLNQLRISDHDINTRGVIFIDNSPSNGQSHSDRLSINLIEDHIVEH